MNVDTVMIHPDYKGMGIFSDLNNNGYLTYTFYRPIDIEGPIYGITARRESTIKRQSTSVSHTVASPGNIS